MATYIFHDEFVHHAYQSEGKSQEFAMANTISAASCLPCTLSASATAFMAEIIVLVLATQSIAVASDRQHYLYSRGGRCLDDGDDN